LDPDSLFREFRQQGASFVKELSFIDDPARSATAATSAILAASIAGYRKWESDDFEDPKPPEWLKDAQPKKDRGPGNLMEKTLGRHRKPE
jgi:hypothetical protein